jgi:hypothetical protein
LQIIDGRLQIELQIADCDSGIADCGIADRGQQRLESIAAASICIPKSAICNLRALWRGFDSVDSVEVG